MSDAALKDSGQREQFDTGSRRDTREGKGRYDLLPPHAIYRLARTFEKGAAKYGDRNWEKGQPLTRYLDSALRHTFMFLQGHRDEDHLAQAMWNLAACIETEHRVGIGLLPDDLNDLAVSVPDDHAITLKDLDAIAGVTDVLRGCPPYFPPDVVLPEGYEWAREYRQGGDGELYAKEDFGGRIMIDRDGFAVVGRAKCTTYGPRHIVRRKGGDS